MFTRTEPSAIASRNVASTSGWRLRVPTAGRARRRRPTGASSRSSMRARRPHRPARASRIATAPDDAGAERTRPAPQLLDRSCRGRRSATSSPRPRGTGDDPTPCVSGRRAISSACWKWSSTERNTNSLIGMSVTCALVSRTPRSSTAVNTGLSRPGIRDAEPPQRAAPHHHPEERPERALVGVEEIERTLPRLRTRRRCRARLRVTRPSASRSARTPQEADLAMRSSVPCVRRSFR